MTSSLRVSSKVATNTSLPGSSSALSVGCALKHDLVYDPRRSCYLHHPYNGLARLDVPLIIDGFNTIMEGMNKLQRAQGGVEAKALKGAGVEALTLVEQWL